jgi:hypothetical protein
MNFDPEQNVFTMTGEESAFLGVPNGATEWPLEGADVLTELVDKAATRLLAEKIDPSDHRAVADHVARVRRTKLSYLTILNADTLSDYNLAQEFGGDS